MSFPPHSLIRTLPRLPAALHLAAPLALCHFFPDSLPSLPHLPRLLFLTLFPLSLFVSFLSFPLSLPGAMTRVSRKSVVAYFRPAI